MDFDIPHLGTPLYTACVSQEIECVQRLLREGEARAHLLCQITIARYDERRRTSGKIITVSPSGEMYCTCIALSLWPHPPLML